MRIRYILLVVLVLLQLLWLGCQYHARTVEMEQAPRLLVACESYDPRDIFRGDYLRLHCNKVLFLGDARIGKSLWWGEALVESGRVRGEKRLHGENGDEVKAELPTPPAGFVALTPRPAECADAVELTRSHFKPRLKRDRKRPLLAGFWKETSSGLWELARVEARGSSQDKPRPGEVRTPLESESPDFCFYRTEEGELLIGAEWKFSLLRSLRYYVPENSGELWALWCDAFPDEAFPSEKLRYVAEIVVRPKSSLMVKRVFVNGIPYEEAAALIRQGKKEELLRGREAWK